MPEELITARTLTERLRLAGYPVPASQLMGVFAGLGIVSTVQVDWSIRFLAPAIIERNLLRAEQVFRLLAAEDTSA